MKIIITEAMEKRLFQRLLNESLSGDSDKVNLVTDYLNAHWFPVNSKIPNDYGECEIKRFAIALDNTTNGFLIYNKEVVKKEPEELYYLLQEKYKNLFGSNITERNSFLKQLVEDWFNGKISKNGNLSKMQFKSKNVVEQKITETHWPDIDGYDDDGDHRNIDPIYDFDIIPDDDEDEITDEKYPF